MNKIYRALNAIICLISIIALGSCAAIGINISHSTPRKAFVYPKFTEKDSLRGFLSPIRSCYDVTYYNLDIALNIKAQSIKGYVDINFKGVHPSAEIQVDLYANMKVDTIIFQHRNISYTRKYNALKLVLGETLVPGEKYQIRIYYHGNPRIAKRPPWEGGFVWEKDHHGNPWIGVACEVDGASLWWPCKDHLSDEPDSMKMNITVPSGLFCVSNGHKTDSLVIGNNVKYSWKITYPINNYDATLYVGDFKHFSIPFHSIDHTTFDMDFYVLPENLEKAKKHFMQADDILHVYETLYGSYPWPRDGFKLVESPFAGMEHQTAIAYGDSYKNDLYKKIDYIILHETAHEWWGNSVTVPDYAEVWLHEGFATYSEALYLERKFGKEYYNRHMAIYSILIRNKRPVVGPHNVNYWDYKDGDVYMKGALMLHTLRKTIDNDSLFFSILKTFYAQHKYGTAVSQQFIDLINEKTSKPMNWFFSQYLYSRVCPEMEWNYRDDNVTGKPRFYFRWTNVGDDFKLPVKIGFGENYTIAIPGKTMHSISIPEGIDIQINTDGKYIKLKKNKDL
jgi:aminopeptidase N